MNCFQIFQSFHNLISYIDDSSFEFNFKMQENIIIDSSDVQWTHPISIQLCGPSNSGKTSIIYNFIRYRDEMLKSDKRLKVFYFLPSRQIIDAPDYILNDPDVSFHENIPDVETIEGNSIVILDDLAEQVNSHVVEMYTRFSHHLRITVLLVSHSLFSGGLFRIISLNTGEFDLFSIH